MGRSAEGGGIWRIVALVGAGVALAAGFLLFSAGPGTRLGFWGFREGLSLLRWAAVGGIGGAVLSILGLVLGGPRLGLGWLGLVIGLAVAWYPLTWYRQVKAVPPIHDISTDLANPPGFVALLAARQASPNGAEYAGPEVAALQLRAYPDLRSAVLPVARETAFRNADAVARSLGWRIAARDPARGTLEATDTTFWFGFKDDVVVRIVAAADGRSVVDVRSASRVGKSDVGTNARRIRTFLAKLQAMP